MARAADAAGSQIPFTRTASGLVRVAGGLDTFIYCIGVIGVGAGIFTGFYYRTYYPGGNLALAITIAGLGGLFVALCFYMWSVTFPRSGGTFVFLSRTSTPGVAFSLTFFEVVAFCFFAALNTTFLVQVGLSPLFSSLSLLGLGEGLDDIATWLAGTTGTFVVGGLILVVTGLVPLFGMRKFLVLQRVMFAIAVIGIILGIVVMLFATPEGFNRSFVEKTGLTRERVLSAAEETGYERNADFGWAATLKLTVWPIAWLAFGVMSSALGGEIKAVRRSQFVGMVGATVVATLAMLLYVPLADRIFDVDFANALVWNSTEAPRFSTAAPPFITLLLGVVSGNIVLAAAIIIGFVAWQYFLISPQLVYAQRLMIAWSFDRLAPERLGYVSERFRSPVVAITLSLIVGLTFLALLVYGVLPLLAYILGVFVVWAVIAAIGAIFPWRSPSFFEPSPIARYRLLGMPAMTVVSALAFLFLAWQVYLYWQDPLVAGHTTATILGHVIAFVGGVITYLIIRAVRTSQGIDVGRVFKELPIE